jgi:hypothetical protein
MQATLIFLVDLVFGYLVATLFAIHYIWPKAKSMERMAALRLIAMIHAFRYFGLSFLLVGVVGGGLPHEFAALVAYGDFLTCLFAIAALLSAKAPKVFLPMVWAFNLVGIVDLVMDTANAIRLGLPAVSGQLGADYAIVTVYVPILFVTHIVAFKLLAKGGAELALGTR